MRCRTVPASARQSPGPAADAIPHPSKKDSLMLRCSSQRALVLALTAASLLIGTFESTAATIVLRSGNIAPTAQDPVIRFLVEPNNSCTTPFPAAFTAADFAAAD